MGYTILSVPRIKGFCRVSIYPEADRPTGERLAQWRSERLPTDGEGAETFSLAGVVGPDEQLREGRDVRRKVVTSNMSLSASTSYMSASIRSPIDHPGPIYCPANHLFLPPSHSTVFVSDTTAAVATVAIPTIRAGEYMQVLREGSVMGEVDAATRERIESDRFCERLGIDLVALEEGYARTEFTVEESLLNFHGTPHGGAIYSLADAAFAAASNARGETAVALETNISYLDAVDTGETLTATAEETHDGGRTAQYEVAITTEDEDLIATFRGRVYRPGR